MLFRGNLISSLWEYINTIAPVTVASSTRKSACRKLSTCLLRSLSQFSPRILLRFPLFLPAWNSGSCEFHKAEHFTERSGGLSWLYRLFFWHFLQEHVPHSAMFWADHNGTGSKRARLHGYRIRLPETFLRHTASSRLLYLPKYPFFIPKEKIRSIPGRIPLFQRLSDIKFSVLLFPNFHWPPGPFSAILNSRILPYGSHRHFSNKQFNSPFYGNLNKNSQAFHDLSFDSLIRLYTIFKLSYNVSIFLHGRSTKGWTNTCQVTKR